MLRFASNSRLTPFPTPNFCRTLFAKYDAQLCWARVNCCKVGRRDFHRGTKGLRSAVEKGDEVEQAFRPASRRVARSRGARDPGGSSSITRPAKPRTHPGLEKRETWATHSYLILLPKIKDGSGQETRATRQKNGLTPRHNRYIMSPLLADKFQRSAITYDTSEPLSRRGH
jgi:hypothetical protein